MGGNIIKKAKRNFMDFGFYNTTIKICKEMFKVFYESKSLIIYDIDFKRNYDVKENVELRFKILDKKDCLYISQVERMEEWLENKLKARIAENGLCVVALNKDEVVGFNLIVFDWIHLPILKIKVLMENHEAWSEQISVKKNYRKMGIANEMRKVTYDILKNKEIVKLFGHRASYNYASKMSAKNFTKNVILNAKYIKKLQQERIEFRNSKEDHMISTIAFNGDGSNKDENGYLILRTGQFIHYENENIIPEEIFQPVAN